MRYRTTVILALLVLAAAVVFLVFKDRLTGKKQETETPSAAGQPVLKDVLDTDVSAVTLEEVGPGGAAKAKLTFKRDGMKWNMTAPVEFPANAFEVDRLLRNVTDARYRQTLDAEAQGKSNLPTLGLEPPAYQLVLTLAAKDKTPERTATVALGKRTSLGEGMYIRVDNAPKVLILERADLLAMARTEPNAYRGRDLVFAARDEIVRIDLQGPKGKAELHRAPGVDSSRWVLAQPLMGRADPEAVSGLIRAALGLAAKEFVADDPKTLSSYGLATPSITLTLWKESAPAPAVTGTDAAATPTALPAAPVLVKAATLRFGAPADPRQATTFFLTDDGRHVVTVDASVLKSLDKSPDNLRDKRVMELDAARASRINLALPAKLTVKEAAADFDLVKVGKNWEVLSGPRKADSRERTDKANTEAVIQLLQELAGLKVLYFAEGENAALARNFTPAGSVAFSVDGAAAPVGFQLDASGALVKNLHEDWVGYINTTTLKSLRKDWIDYIDPKVLSFDEAAVTGLEIQTLDRKEVFAKTGQKWRLAAPIESDVNEALVGGIIKILQALRAEKFVAATKDYKPYGLETGQLTVTVTLAPAKAGLPADLSAVASAKAEASAKAGEEPVRKILRLASDEKTHQVLARVEGNDLVFSLAPQMLGLLASEPVDTQMTAMSEFEVDRVEITGDAGRSLTLIKNDNKWFRANAAGEPAEEISSDVTRDIIGAATDLRAARWAAYDTKDPAAYGLDKPALRIKVAGDRSSLTILVSDKPVPESVTNLLEMPPARYAMTEDGKRIAVIAGPAANILVTALETLAPKKPPVKADEPKPAPTATAPAATVTAPATTATAPAK
jgi:hypothetical protein